MLLIIQALFSSKIGMWLRGPTMCSRALTALIYILNSGMCSTQHYTTIHFIFVPVHVHNAERTKVKILLGETYRMRHLTLTLLMFPSSRCVN